MVSEGISRTYMPVKLLIPPSPTQRQVRRIGFFAPSEAEYVQRIIEGVLRFQADRGGCVVRDFRFHPDAPEIGRRGRRGLTPGRMGSRRARDQHRTRSRGCPSGCRPPTARGQYRLTGQDSSHGLHFKPALVGVASSIFARSALKTSPTSPAERRPTLFTLPADSREKQEAGSRDHPSPESLLLGQRHRNPTGGEPALVELLTQSPSLWGDGDERQCRAVVCLAASSLGLDIPSQVAVLGANNAMTSRSSLPPISSIHIPYDELGYQAMDILCRKLDGEAVSESNGSFSGQGDRPAIDQRRRRPRNDVVRARQIIQERACEGVTIAEILHDLAFPDRRSSATSRRSMAFPRRRVVARPH